MKRKSSADTLHQLNLFVRLCRWLWHKQSFFWSTIILGIVLNLVSTWFVQSQTIDYGNSPFGLTLHWMSQHITIVLCIGVMILLIDVAIYLGSHSAPAKAATTTTTMSVAVAT